MVEQMTGTCANCAAPLRPGAAFCPRCGAPAPAAAPATPVLATEPAGAAWTAQPASAAPSRLGQMTPLALLVLIGGVVLALWMATVKNDVPFFATVLDFKIMLATAVMLLAVVQALAAAVFYGWLRLPGLSADAAAFIHRWNGRVVLPAAALVTIYCVKDIGPQSSPARAALHSVFGGAVFVVVAAKLIILRGVPRLSGLLPALGMAITALFIGIWATSAFYAIRTRAQGYSSAEVGATVGIVTDPRTIGRFDPLTIRVRVGQAVVWVNQDNAPHNAVKDGGGFDSGIIAPGGSFRWPAKTPGTITYRCTIHPQMAVATVVVEDK